VSQNKVLQTNSTSVDAASGEAFAMPLLFSPSMMISRFHSRVRLFGHSVSTLIEKR